MWAYRAVQLNANIFLETPPLVSSSYVVTSKEVVPGFPIIITNSETMHASYSYVQTIPALRKTFSLTSFPTRESKPALKVGHNPYVLEPGSHNGAFQYHVYICQSNFDDAIKWLP